MIHHNMGRKPIAAALWPALALASSLFAQTPQTAQTTFFRAEMSSSAGSDSGVTDVLVHAVKDASGNILSGSLDLNFAYQFPNDNIVTGLGVACGPTAVAATLNVPATSGACESPLSFK